MNNENLTPDTRYGSTRSEDTLAGTPLRLDGRLAVVTGGTSGLGFAIATCLVNAGARVAVVSRHGAENLAPLGDAAVHYTFDVTNTDDAQSLVDKIIAEQGPIDILVNNAGVHRKKTIEDMTIQDYTDVLDVHLVGAFALTKAVVPTMKQQGRGSIIFIASMVSYIGMPMVAGYSTAKAGYLGLIHSLAVELGPSGIRVNGIAPGWIDTPMYRKAIEGDPDRERKILSRTPLARVGDPEDIGMAAVFLASDAGKFISGACLPVDGGALIGF